LISENPYKSVFIRVLFLYYFLLIVPKWHFLTITFNNSTRINTDNTDQHRLKILIN
jgi:hypothetical protein